MKTVIQTQTPFTTQQVQTVIKNAKISKASNPNNISQIHLKPLGQNAIQYITDIFKHSWKHNQIPDILKKTIIIAILKPNKPHNEP